MTNKIKQPAFSTIMVDRRANEIILAGSPISAAEALKWGVFNRVCSAKDLMPAVIALAETITDNAPLAVRQAKKAIHEGLQMDVRTHFASKLKHIIA